MDEPENLTPDPFPSGKGNRINKQSLHHYIPTVGGFWIESGGCRLVLRNRRLNLLGILLLCG